MLQNNEEDDDAGNDAQRMRLFLHARQTLYCYP